MSPSAASEKNTRVSLPMELELALPFVPTTDGLPQFAAVSKACRNAARDSYQQRTKKKTLQIPENNNDTVPAGKPQISSQANQSYLNPWWRVKERKENLQGLGGYESETHPYQIEIQDDGSWIPTTEFSWEGPPPPLPTQRKLTFPATHLELFNNDDTELVHCSSVDQRMLIILCRWTDRGTHSYNAPETRKQLFAVLYDLTASIDGDNNALLLPTICHKLTEPLDPCTYGVLDGIHFGNGVRSRNGKAIAVVTALPLGNESRDSRYLRGTAQVTVLDITDTALNPRCALEFPIGARTNDSWLTMTLSNAGELLSINSLRNESEQEHGDWGVYDVRTSNANIIAQKNQVEKHFLSHQFTPDDELLLVLPQRERETETGWSTIDEAVDDDAFFSPDVKIPAWLAKRMIVLVAEEQDYRDLVFHNDDDDE